MLPVSGLVFGEVLNQSRDALAEHVVGHCKIGREDEHRDDHDGSGGLDLGASGCDHLAHLAAHVLEELHQFARPGFEPLHPTALLFFHCNRLRHGAASNLSSAVVRASHAPPFSEEAKAGKLAGELGFEPRSSVLETDSLTVKLTPPGAVGFKLVADG